MKKTHEKLQRSLKWKVANAWSMLPFPLALSFHAGRLYSAPAAGSAGQRGPQVCPCYTAWTTGWSLGNIWESPCSAERAEGPFGGQKYPSLPACVCLEMDQNSLICKKKKNKKINYISSGWLCYMKHFQHVCVGGRGRKTVLLPRHLFPEQEAWKHFQSIGSTPEEETQTAGTPAVLWAAVPQAAMPQPSCLHPQPASDRLAPSCQPSAKRKWGN